MAEFPVRRTLVVCPEPPFPPIGGGPLRTASLIEYAARRGIVDLVLFAVDGASDPVAALPTGLVNDFVKIPLPAHSRSPLARIARNTVRLVTGAPPLLDRFSGQEAPLGAWLQGRTYDVAIIEHFWCAPYASLLQRHCQELFLNLHNIESEWHERSASIDFWPVSVGHRRFAACYRKLEHRLLPEFDGVLVPSRREGGHLSRPRRIIVYPNAIPLVPLPQPTPGFSIVFSGNLEYLPNQQAVRFFNREVWPLLRRRWPKLKWRIVGKNPRGIAREVAGDPAIEITGAVENAIVELAKSQLSVIPVLTGSGTRVKILEAWAAGLPVVATTLGAEGLDANPGVHLLLADTPADLAASISTLLEAPLRRAQVACAGRALYEERYTWDAAWKILEKEKFLAH